MCTSYLFRGTTDKEVEKIILSSCLIRLLQPQFPLQYEANFPEKKVQVRIVNCLGEKKNLLINVFEVY